MYFILLSKHAQKEINPGATDAFVAAHVNKKNMKLTAGESTYRKTSAAGENSDIRVTGLVIIF